MKDTTIKMQEEITAVLDQGTMEYGKIFERLPQYSRSAVARVLIIMVDAGKIITSGSKVHKKYTLAKNFKRVPATRPVEFRQMRPRDLYEHWRLCERIDPRHADQPPQL